MKEDVEGKRRESAKKTARVNLANDDLVYLDLKPPRPTWSCKQA